MGGPLLSGAPRRFAMRDPRTDSALLLDALRLDGPLASAALARRLRLSQPTLWRRMAALMPPVVALGRGRATRYALPGSLMGWAPAQPLVWTDAAGGVHEWGVLTALSGARVHTWGPGVDLVTPDLPWFLSPLRAQGFLGRLLARRLAPQGLAGDPERWPLEQVLFAALQLNDPPGAFRLGPEQGGDTLPLDSDAQLDAAAEDVARTMPAGSSAGGEQAKCLGRLATGEAVLVKFSPPHGTPFGTRWSDLLRAEHLALRVLSEHGVAVAGSQWRRTARRSYLLSHRFDRVGAAGRRHAVALAAWHDAFVGGARRHWEATCQALVQQRRVPPDTAVQAGALLHYGRLIGNSDMHFGNLSLWVEREDLAAGRGRLAPVYDMLPMRWRPDPATGSLDLSPFTPDPADLRSGARPVAEAFWQAVARDEFLTPGFRRLAAQMLPRLRA